MVEEPITMGEGPILYLLAPSITRFVGFGMGLGMLQVVI
jgi:hypothetical protein